MLYIRYQKQLSRIEYSVLVYHVCVWFIKLTDFCIAESFHTKSLLQFIRNEQLYLPLYHEKCAIDYTYSNTCANSFSTIDHFFVLRNLASFYYYAVLQFK